MIYINTDELYFIETPDFPKTMSEGCQLNFIGQNYANSENLRMIFVATNGILNFHFTDSTSAFEDRQFYISKNPELSLNIGVTPNSYQAFQGMIMLQDWGDHGCPFEPIAYYQPFHFTDDSQIFYLGRDISRIPQQQNDDEHFITNCRWHFSAPKGYHFKIIVEFGTTGHNHPKSTLNISSSNGDFIITRPNLDPDIYYIDSSEITVSYNNIHDPGDFYGYADYFHGYVSIYKNGFHVSEIKCNVTKYENITTWTNIDDEMLGYPNNAKCSLNLTIPIRHAIIVEAKTYIMEIADTLIGYIGIHKIDMREFPINHQLVLQAHDNGYNNDLYWEFKSGANIQSLGFYITFTEMECKCGPPSIIVPCTGEYKTNIMNNENDYYCDDLQCNFTLTMDEGCNISFYKLSFNLIEFNDGFYFSIISNNHIMYETSPGITPIIRIFLSSSDINIFHFVSSAVFYENANPKSFYILSSAVEKPYLYPSIILTEENPLHIFYTKNMEANSIITIKFDENLIAQNDIFEVIFETDDFTNVLVVYNDENLTSLATGKNIVPSNLATPPFSYYILSKTITIYKIRNHGNFETVLFRAKKRHSKNCYFENNIYKRCIINEISTSESYFGIIAEGGGACEVVVFTCNDIKAEWKNQLSKVWTSSKNVTVKMIGEKNNLLEFSNKDSHLWRDILLTSPIFTIIIPPFSAIYLTFSEYTFPILINKYPYKTVWISPFYGFETDNFVKSYTYKISNSFVVTFTVLETSIFAGTSVTINFGDNTSILINETGQTFNVAFDEDLTPLTIQYTQNGPPSKVVIGSETNKK